MINMSDTDLTTGEGQMNGKGLYAAREFKKGEVVLKVELKPISFKELKSLSADEYLAAHNINGQIYIFGGGLARYVNHSDSPNVVLDLEQGADIALRDITVGEKITADTRLDDVPVLKKINAVLIKVPSIQEGLDFYREQLGLQTFWKKKDIASVHLGDGQLVMSTTLDPETNILVESVEHAASVFVKAGGKVVSPPEDIDVGKLTIVEDAFGNQLTLVDFSKGFYIMDEAKNVTGLSNDDVIKAHVHASQHHSEILASQSCGCFYCLETFPPDEIDEWLDSGQTALCPRCGIDAVLGDRAGYLLDKDFLSKMHGYWF
jgi:predicted enzyme related to lactoylglutathione lyase